MSLSRSCADQDQAARLPAGPPRSQRLRRCRKRYVLSRCTAPEGPGPAGKLASSLPGRGWEPVRLWQLRASGSQGGSAAKVVVKLRSPPSCSEGPGPPLHFPLLHLLTSPCFPVEEASAPAVLFVSLQPGGWSLASAAPSPTFWALGAQADEAGCSAQPSPERQPVPLEPRPAALEPTCCAPAAARCLHPERAQLPGGQRPAQRAEAALDALDKAQRQLQACKRGSSGAGRKDQAAAGAVPRRSGPGRRPGRRRRSTRRTCHMQLSSSMA